MNRRAVLAAAFGVFLLVATASAPALGRGTGPVTPARGIDSTAPPAPAFLPEDGTSIPTDSRSIRISVQPDGDATWTVQYRLELDDDNATASFESIRARIEANPLQFTGPFRQTMQSAASVAANDTGREMTVRNVTVRARKLPNQFGVVTYRFEWTNFAATSGGTVRVGDALRGLFLASERSSLLVEWPEGLESTEVRPEPDDTRAGAVVWRGPTEFASDEPRVVLTGASPLPVDATGLLAGGAVLLVVGVVGWQVWTRRQRDAPDAGTPAGAEATAGAAPDAGIGDAATDPGGGEPATADTGSDAADADAGSDTDAAAESTAGADDAGSTADADVGTDDAGSAAEAAAGASEEADEEGPPPELLSDEERVLQLLEDNGGRMKQQDVVEHMEWSETKTSQVVREMREDDQIEVFRLGRENVLSLPGEMDV